MDAYALTQHIRREHALGVTDSVAAMRTVHEVAHTTEGTPSHRHDWSDTTFEPWVDSDE